MLNEITKILMQMLGEIHHHHGLGDVMMALLDQALFNTSPQDQVVGSPRPKKLRLDSEITAEAKIIVELTVIGPVMLISKCLNMMRAREYPKPSAASMYCILRAFKAAFFVTRAKEGQEKTPMITATVLIEGPTIAAVIICKGNCGRVRKISMTASKTWLAADLE